MFGKIVNIDENIVEVENISHIAHSEVMNTHVVFLSNDRKIIGEIIKINTNMVTILLVGEIIDGKFLSGITKKPSSAVSPRLIYKEELELIIGSQSSNLIIGKSAIYNNYNISVEQNLFFANHNAIIGNTGSGKSCGVARILQNLFINSNEKPLNSSFVLFDAYGEYSNTFNELNNIGMCFKKYNTKIENSEENQLVFPAYYLDADDLAILLQVNDSSMIPILEKTLQLVYIFTSKEEKVIDYKNDIIAK